MMLKRFLNPDQERLELAKLDNLQYRGSGEKYFEEFKLMLSKIKFRGENNNIN
jgi:hypothetical protein